MCKRQREGKEEKRPAPHKKMPLYKLAETEKKPQNKPTKHPQHVDIKVHADFLWICLLQL